MRIIVHGETLPPDAALPGEGTPAVLFIGMEEVARQTQRLGLTHLMASHLDESATNRYEGFDAFECLLLNIPDETEDIEAPPRNIDIYYSPGRIVFVHDPAPAIDALMERLTANPPLPFERVLPVFLGLLTEKDAAYLEEFEEAIAKLEDDIAGQAREDYLAQISALRKKLLKQKRYFESLMDALDDMLENVNGFFHEAQLRSLKMIYNRADRQFHSVLNLRDYVTQVREAYQAQLDINLNETMKFFTVVATIFLPLTLLVGWYGMNFDMPEYSQPYTYPLVVVVSILVVVSLVVYFKRKKWF